MKGKKFFCFLIVLFIACAGLFAGTISVAVDGNSTYKPTTIVNGSFSSKPWMTYVYNGTTYNSSSSGYTKSNVSPSSITPNGVDGGWNTSETSTYCGSLFEWSGNSSVFSHFYVTNSILASNGRYFVDMNCNHASVLYQDLTTIPGDVVRWTLQHAPSIKGTAETVQDMHVEVGTPNGTPSGTNSNIKSSGKAIYKSTGITLGSGTVAFANSSELTNLSVSRSGKTDSSYSDTVAECNAFFKDVAGVYCVPAGQTVTRFAFVSDDSTYPTCGNLLSNLTFNTLIGNLHGNYNTDGSISVYGYWGETDTSKKLVIKTGSKVHQISMTNVCGKNFKITIPSDELDPNSFTVDVYHQNYESAKKTIHIHKWVYLAKGQILKAYCENTASAEQCSYQGIEHLVDVTLATNRIDITATMLPANSDDLILWSSANSAVAKIDAESGIINAVKAGSTTITAGTKGGTAKATRQIRLHQS